MATSSDVDRVSGPLSDSAGLLQGASCEGGGRLSTSKNNAFIFPTSKIRVWLSLQVSNSWNSTDSLKISIILRCTTRRYLGIISGPLDDDGHDDVVVVDEEEELVLPGGEGAGQPQDQGLHLLLHATFTGSGFIFYGSGSRIFSPIRIRIQATKNHFFPRQKQNFGRNFCFQPKK